MTRIRVSRDQVLQFNSLWDASDRRQLAAFLDGDGSSLTYKDEIEPRRPEIDRVVASIPERLDHMYRTASNKEVRGLDAQGRLVFAIRPGAIDLGPDIDKTIVHFTTVGWWGPRRSAADEEDVAVCPVHFVQLPRSGVCDMCE